MVLLISAFRTDGLSDLYRSNPFFNIPARLNTPYYHMIDDQDYAAFKWIENNVSTNYETAILDPWKATAFTAITGKKVYTRIHLAPFEKDFKAYAFLQNGCDNSTFLKENNISIIYSRLPCRNSDLVEVRENVYLLENAEYNNKTGNAEVPD